MVGLNRLLDGFTASPIGEVFALATRLKAAGRDIIDLSIGEPDFPTPDHVKAAGLRAIETGDTRYTEVDGTAALKRAIAGKLRAQNGLAFEPEQIVVDAGSKPLLARAVQTLINPGDEVIVPVPCWASYTGMVAIAGGRVVPVECRQARGFRLAAADLAAAITPRTRLVFLNSPGNPTGAVLSPDDLRAIADLLLDHPDVAILSDEIYEHLVFGNAVCRSIAAVEPRLSERTLVVNGLSKAYSMTGWRIGYLAGPAPIVRAIRALMSQTTGSPPTASQAAAVAALEGPQDHLAERAMCYEKRRDLAVGALGRIAGLTVDRPDGAFYLYPGCAGILGRHTPQGAPIASSIDLARYLIETAGVATVPGSAFALDPHLRLSYAAPEALLVAATTRIAAALAQLN